jgi:two-component system, OmpR family, alkaline phosphatase synthesis response regulator PhoP
VTDYQMPFMTGLELIEKLRSNEQTKETPVILLTARSFAISEEVQKSLNVEACLSKPFSPKELLKSIQDILYQKEVALKC